MIGLLCGRHSAALSSALGALVRAVRVTARAPASLGRLQLAAVLRSGRALVITP